MQIDKRKIILLFLVLVSYPFMECRAQDDLNNLIVQIKAQCDKINSDSKLYKITQVDVNDLTSEGGILKKFYEDKVLKKAELTLFGETGQSTTQYYFHNGELIFVNSVEKMYKEPINMGKMETASSDKNEYYFKNQILVRWVNNNGKIAEQALYLPKQIELLGDLKIINQQHLGDK